MVSTAALDAALPRTLPRGLTSGAGGAGPRGTDDSSLSYWMALAALTVGLGVTVTRPKPRSAR